jgi:hypothetical protein
MSPTAPSPVSEVLIDDSLSILKSVPVHVTKYNGILRWHVKPGSKRVRHTYVYKTMKLVPLYTVADSFCVAYWLEHPAVLFKFILGKLTRIEQSAVAGLVDFMMVRAIKTKLFVRVVHSTRLTALEKIPSNGFLRNTCLYTIRCWSSFVIFPAATPNILPIIRLASYLGLAHPNYTTFNSDQEYEQHIRQASFEMMGSDICEVEASSWVAQVDLLRRNGKLEPVNEVCLPFPLHPDYKFGMREFQQIRFPDHSVVSLTADEATVFAKEGGDRIRFEVLGVDPSHRCRSPANQSRLSPITEDESE